MLRKITSAKNNLITTCMCLSNSNQTTSSSPCSHFAPGQTFLRLFSCDISVWKENPAQLFAATCYFLCVCNQPKIFPVLLTSSSTQFCPCDAFAHCVQILLCQRNFCLLRHRCLLLPYCCPTPTARQPAPVCPLSSSFYDT